MGGSNQVLLYVPPAHILFDATAFRTWASKESQCGVGLGQLYCHIISGIQGHAFVLKVTVRSFGWGRWKGHTQGSLVKWGEINKQTWDAHQITFSGTRHLHDAQKRSYHRHSADCLTWMSWLRQHRVIPLSTRSESPVEKYQGEQCKLRKRRLLGEFTDNNRLHTCTLPHIEPYFIGFYKTSLTRSVPPTVVSTCLPIFPFEFIKLKRNWLSLSFYIALWSNSSDLFLSLVFVFAQTTLYANKQNTLVYSRAGNSLSYKDGSKRINRDIKDVTMLKDLIIQFKGNLWWKPTKLNLCYTRGGVGLGHVLFVFAFFLSGTPGQPQWHGSRVSELSVSTSTTFHTCFWSLHQGPT